VHLIKSYYDVNLLQHIFKYLYTDLLIKDIIGCICRKIIEYKLNPQKNEESENAETTTACDVMTTMTCAETYLEKMTKSKKREEEVEEKKRD
jgi:p-aminobenzoyl-glutamate transporter AbgT